MFELWEHNLDIFRHVCKPHVGLIGHFIAFLGAKAATAFSAIAVAILSVRPSVTRVNQSKTVQARITKSLPSATWKTLLSETVKLFHKFEKGPPWTRALNERGVGKICDFWPISHCISVTVWDRAYRLTINH